MSSHRHPDQPTTIKTMEAQALLLDIEQKNARVRGLGLVMLSVICVGVMAAVILGAVIFNSQRAERTADEKRRKAQETQGSLLLTDIYDRLNHMDKLISEHVGEEPLPPLVVPTTTTTVRRSTTSASARSTTTTTRSNPSTSSTTSSTSTTSTSTSTTSTTQPTPPTTQPETCVGPVCLKGIS